MRVFFISLITLFVIIFIYFFNQSYQYSLEAKTFYELGEYEKAYQLAKKAYELEPYNRMAFTILTQSEIAKEWKNYIEESKNYFKKIEEISNKKVITKKDKIRVKMMLEIIIEKYKLLKNSKLIDKKLKQEAYTQYKKGEKLYEEVF
jgi:tetratricopeptide (TPR) repeat protein